MMKKISSVVDIKFVSVLLFINMALFSVTWQKNVIVFCLSNTSDRSLFPTGGHKKNSSNIKPMLVRANVAF